MVSPGTVLGGEESSSEWSWGLPDHAKHVRERAVTKMRVSRNQGLTLHRKCDVSSVLASGDALQRTQVRTLENKEEFTATGKKSGPTAGRTSATTSGKSGPTACKKSIANCRRGIGHDEVQDKDQDEVKFKMSFGMGDMNCADNTGGKNFAILILKGSEAA